MRVVKSKTLREVKPRTRYMGCTFYLEGPHCLDDCVFENCSFRGELHYVEAGNDADNGIYHSFPEFINCSFNCSSICCETKEHQDVDYWETDNFILPSIATKMKVVPIYEWAGNISIDMDLPKIKTIDLSAYESYSEIPVEWFERFPTLEEVILPINSPTIDHQVLVDNEIDYYPVFNEGVITHREVVRRFWSITYGGTWRKP